MGGRTGYPDFSNGDDFGFAEYMEALEDHFDDLIGESKPTASDLPSSGNWLGRTIMAEDTGVSYKCIGLPGAWLKLQDSPFAMESRVTNVTIGASGSSWIVNVSFTAGTFSQPPIVMATLQASPGVARKLNVQATAITKDGFQLVVSTGDATNPGAQTAAVGWWATQMSSAAGAGAS